MMEQERIVITDEFIKEAEDYANLSCGYTSNRHDFHEVGLNAKQRKMYQGKLGEKIFKTLLIDENIAFSEDSTSHTVADNYDFVMPDNSKIDVKTRTENFHTRTLEIVEQFLNKPKDIYVSVRLFSEKKEGIIVGWCTKEDFINVNRIENLGYLDNYVLHDAELRPICKLIELFREKGFNLKKSY
jgi:hypothetical protein